MKRGTYITAAAALGVALMFTGCDASATLQPEATVMEEPAVTETPAATSDNVQDPGGAEDVTSADVAAEPLPSETTDAESTMGTQPDTDLPAPDPAFMTLTLAGHITDIDREQDIFYISEQLPAEGATADPANSVGAVEVDDCIMIDAQTGTEVDDDALRVGEEVTAYVGLAMSRSIPPQSACSAIITNMPTDGTSAAYVRVQEVTEDTDGIRVLNQNADLYVIIPQDLSIEVYDEPGQTLSLSAIQPGTRMIVWYGMTTRSIPPQAVATKVVVDVADMDG